jgi:hypothetical protein
MGCLYENLNLESFRLTLPPYPVPLFPHNFFLILECRTVVDYLWTERRSNTSRDVCV